MYRLIPFIPAAIIGTLGTVGILTYAGYFDATTVLMTILGILVASLWGFVSIFPIAMLMDWYDHEKNKYEERKLKKQQEKFHSYIER